MKAAPFEFDRVGNVVDDEGKHQHEQMCAITVKKVTQYMPDSPNARAFVKPFR